MKPNQKLHKIWKLRAEARPLDKQTLMQAIARHLEFSVCKNRHTVNDIDVYESVAFSIRDHLVKYWHKTYETYQQQGCKQVYYFSLEYLMGRSLRHNLINFELLNICQAVLQENGYDLEEIEDLEADAGLGNGGLGRLAACFLDSMTTLQLPAYGYGIRYEYGIFEQKIEAGAQVEHPDNWLAKGYPWEIPRFDFLFPVRFYGHVRDYQDADHQKRYEWVETQDVLAMAYDVPIAGYQTQTVNNLRLWQAKPSQDFDFDLFNSGDYMQAVAEKQKTETISRVLYPNDKNFSGKELRLKQQYFFICASLQDIIRQYKAKHATFAEFSDKVAIQLNDTHPSLAIAELMRIFIDEEGMPWESAWQITTRVFAYTNHTVLPEALEKWPVSMLGNLLPRHLQIIYEINERFLETVKQQYPGDLERLGRMSLIEEDHGKQVRMPYLAIVGSHVVNGVAALHTKLLKTTIFKDFYEMYPERFQNKTNGISHRRWLLSCNPELAHLITETIGDGWIKNPLHLKELVPFAENGRFQKDWQATKQLKKQQFADWLLREQGVAIPPESLFNVQIKRIHEYKRQLLNVLHVIALYNQMLAHPEKSYVPRTVILGGKAAPGYDMAKLIIQLANDVARVINSDPLVRDRLKVVFLENYRVSLAEKIIPATDISEHLSTAGTEASGTSNMKFSLNGSLIIGTMDGATIEIREEVGEENIFIFGLNAEEVSFKKREGYNPSIHYQNNWTLQAVLEMIHLGHFNAEHPQRYHDIYNALIYEDTYLLLADFSSYMACQEKVGQTYLHPEQWTKMSILNTAGMGKFSTDRTIAEYAKEIWHIQPVPVKAQRGKTR